MAKKILISGYIGFNNFGDDAIFELLTNNLKKRNTQISALSSNPSYTEKKYNIKAYYYKNIKEIISALLNTDVLISGGGSLLQNGTSNLSLLYYLFVIIMAKIMKKKIIIFAQGIGPIEGILYEFLTVFALYLADIITVRDVSSLKFLNKYKLRGRLVMDPVWSVDVPHIEENIVGVQLRNSVKITDIFVKELAHQVGIYYLDKKIKIFLMQNSQDRKISETFLRYLKKEYTSVNAEIVEYTDVQKLIQDFSHLNTLIAMRYHACLLGFKIGVKTLCLSYNKKDDDLCKDFCTICEKVSDSLNLVKLFEDFYNYKEPEIFKQKRKIGFDWDYYDSIVGKEIKK